MTIKEKMAIYERNKQRIAEFAADQQNRDGKPTILMQKIQRMRRTLNTFRQGGHAA